MEYSPRSALNPMHLIRLSKEVCIWARKVDRYSCSFKMWELTDSCVKEADLLEKDWVLLTTVSSSPITRVIGGQVSVRVRKV